VTGGAGAAGAIGVGGSAGSTGAGGAAGSMGAAGAAGSAGVAGAGGTSSVRVCVMVDENENLTVTCPAGTTVLTVDFASYGTPTGACGSFAASDCHATTSQAVFDAACVGVDTCTVAADNATFGDPCNGTLKHLYVEATCGTAGN
jgi:hypothetical protein